MHDYTELLQWTGKGGSNSGIMNRATTALLTGQASEFEVRAIRLMAAPPGMAKRRSAQNMLRDFDDLEKTAG